MRTKTNVMLLAVCLLSVCVLSSCAWFVPSAIKTEASLIATEMITAQAQVPPLVKKAKTTLEEADKLAAAGKTEEATAKYREASIQSLEAANKVMRSYARSRPHAVNLERYMLRQLPEE